MALENAISAAVSGLRANAERVQAVADNVANVSTPGYVAREIVTTSVVTRNSGSYAGTGGGVRTYSRPANPVPATLQESQTVDLAVEFSRLIEARTAYGVAADLIRTESEMLREHVTNEA